MAQRTVENMEEGRRQQSPNSTAEQEHVYVTTPMTMDDIIQTSVRAILCHEAARPQQVAPLQYSAPKNSELNALLPEFRGHEDDADMWIRQIDAVQTSYQVSDDVLKLIIVGKLSGDALRWYHSKVAHVSMPWQQLKSEFKSMFATKTSRLVRMRKFEARKWKKDEKFTSYFADKVFLGNKADVDEELMMEYLIDGFNNVTLQNQARMRDFTSPGELLQIMKNIPNGGGGDQTTSSKSTESTPRSRVPPLMASSTLIRCFNCNSLGHRAVECLKPKRAPGSCFTCGDTTHKAKDCPQKKKPAAAGQAASPATHLVTKEKPIHPPLVQPVYMQLRPLDKYKIVLSALIDSGSPISLIRADVLSDDLYDKNNNEHVGTFYGVNGSPIVIEGSFTRLVEIADVTVGVKFLVVPECTMNHVCLLGRDVLCSGRLELKIGSTISVTALQDTGASFSDELLNIDILNIESDKSNCHAKLNVDESIDPVAHMRLQSDFVTCYLNPGRPERPVTQVNLKLIVKSDEMPFSSQPRRLSFADRAAVGEIVNDLMERKVIRKSTSEYSSPIVLVKRKDKLRMCVDYRCLNAFTKRDNFPLPLVEDHIDLLRDKSFFTKLDLCDAFHHIDVDPDSIKFTSFVTPVGQYEYLKMPFGLKNAPSCFMRFVSSAFRDLIDENKVLIYMDDILIATATIQENLEILREVYAVLVRNKLDLRLDKCHFLATHIVYLGYCVCNEGIRPSEENVKSVTDFPIPSNYRSLRSFIGLASYFRRFIRNFSITMKPLYDLLKEERTTPKEFNFESEHLCVFETIKAELTSRPLLRIYSPKLETQLHCDASAQGLASILLQKQDDGFFHPVFYFSRRTTSAESRLHSFELEALAIVSSLQRFRIYLQGLHFTIITDCNSLKMTLEKRDICPKILRWSLVLAQFDYSVEHRKGERMQHVDALSRCVSILEENSLEKNLALMQYRDPVILSLRETLESKELPSYELRNGLVYRKYQGKLLFYVPNRMTHHIIRSCHDDIGHVGLQKTLDLIMNNYWFPKMSSVIQEYIQNCLKCIAYQPKSGRAEGLLHPIPKGTMPFVTLHLDHYGPLEKTPRHYKYVFVVVDSFSKYVKLYPCKTTNAAETMKHLRSYFQSFNRPERVIADRGSNFRSKEFSSFLEELNVKLILVAKSTPRANGQVERINRDLTPMIAKLVSTTNKWDSILNDVEFALNNTCCRSTGQYPSVLVFGMRQRGRVNDLLKEFLAQEQPDSRNLETVREAAASKLLNEQIKNKIYYDKSHKPAKVYSVGDFVVCTNIDVTPGVNKKHLPKFRGPYEIKRVLPNDRYYVEDVEGLQVTQIPYKGVLAASDMKPWVSP